MDLRKKISTLFSTASPKVSLTDDSSNVVYAGADTPTSGSKADDFEFGFYMFPGPRRESIWMSGITSNTEVISQLKDMKEGQVFKITAEESDGPLGTRVNAIAIDPKSPTYTIPAHKPMILKS